MAWKPRYKQTEGRITFVYRFDSEDIPHLSLRLKVETNTREHFSVYGFQEIPFQVESRWFRGSCRVHTYQLSELLGTKLRALYQRKAGRDLFDLATALKSPAADARRIVGAFLRYMEHERHKVTRALFEENFALKLRDPDFLADITPLLAPEYHWEPQVEGAEVLSRLIALLPGAPWKGDAE